ncbi:MAG: Rne/Rng family ribonuclease [Syntrophobacterales bacterium]|nr:Rne/Rng family ribonuclease [Syntrophobacterales bacterium]
MKKIMLINAVDEELSRMAVLESGKLVEYNIQMSAREPITGNIYKGVVLKVERGLQAAFVDYGAKKHGFLPLHDVSPEYFRSEDEGGEEGHRHRRPLLRNGQELLVQVVREEKDHKGAMLTTYISLPGRYIVLMPNRQSTGISRKIDDDESRKNLMALMEQIAAEDRVGFIVRTAGMNRTKQELSRDYYVLLKIWRDIEKKAREVHAPALIHQEGDFGVRSLRDYFTSEIQEILVDDLETFRKMRAYINTVAPRNVKMIKLYQDKTPLFDRYHLEPQIDAIYKERVELKSGGYLIINPTEAMITIDVNSGRASDRRDVEETAYRANLEAAEEIARQLRLRDLGGLIVIDFIDMKDRKHIAEIEKAFKKALSLDRARTQISRISKFGMMELSRQRKKSNIQEISHVTCPHCKGAGMRPSLEYAALSTFRKIRLNVLKGTYASVRITLPHEIANYLLNQKRSDIVELENQHNVSILISGNPDMLWEEAKFEFVEREPIPLAPPEAEEAGAEEPRAEGAAGEAGRGTRKKRSRRGRRRSGERKEETAQEGGPAPAEPQPAPGPEEPARQEPPEEKKPGGGIITRIYDIFKF